MDSTIGILPAAMPATTPSATMPAAFAEPGFQGALGRCLGVPIVAAVTAARKIPAGVTALPPAPQAAPVTPAPQAAVFTPAPQAAVFTPAPQAATIAASGMAVEAHPEVLPSALSSRAPQAGAATPPAAPLKAACQAPPLPALWANAVEVAVGPEPHEIATPNSSHALPRATALAGAVDAAMAQRSGKAGLPAATADAAWHQPIGDAAPPCPAMPLDGAASPPPTEATAAAPVEAPPSRPIPAAALATTPPLIPAQPIKPTQDTTLPDVASPDTPTLAGHAETADDRAPRAEEPRDPAPTPEASTPEPSIPVAVEQADAAPGTATSALPPPAMTQMPVTTAAREEELPGLPAIAARMQTLPRPPATPPAEAAPTPEEPTNSEASLPPPAHLPSYPLQEPPTAIPASQRAERERGAAESAVPDRLIPSGPLPTVAAPTQDVPPAPPARLPAAPPAIRQVTQVAIALAFAPGAAGGFSLTLEPAEMGRVEIRVQRGGEAHSIRILADRPETLALLQRDRQELDRGLADAGLRVDARGIEFALSDRGDAPGQDRPQTGPHAAGRQRATPAEPEAAAPRLSRGLLDLNI